jgi:DivIVA domain-containing protein
VDSKQIRTVEFRESLKGYHRTDIDELLEAIARAVDAGRSPRALLQDVHPRLTLKGYNRDDVDEFLELLRKAY